MLGMLRLYCQGPHEATTRTVEGGSSARRGPKTVERGVGRRLLDG